MVCPSCNVRQTCTATRGGKKKKTTKSLSTKELCPLQPLLTAGYTPAPLHTGRWRRPCASPEEHPVLPDRSSVRPHATWRDCGSAAPTRWLHHSAPTSRSEQPKQSRTLSWLLSAPSTASPGSSEAPRLGGTVTSEAQFQAPTFTLMAFVACCSLKQYDLPRSFCWQFFLAAVDSGI